ncbi:MULTISPECIES: HMP-PP phosphatase [Edwardsiella]|uniref:Cof family hydrolase n=2 Tax=Edwardsiella anguillarum TaxID=1821960 RepID=A0A076LUY5_9GAMM|nr:MULTISPECIES: HMP-PP phosphatase [Edwardsiella]AKM48460.1 thiamin pyrimidine pyrophosphate hydrolase [Edwardsiella sp. EA181011]GAJ67703.1 cof family hydrolase [Edwardsiella piscicida]AIJ09374.1 cof family hydrolase [Edwardsiella anguillarum ET080813]AKR77199.1 HMP-PP phosphatase [Edwardsiella sp. LADL05-105]KAB0590419.1 HMP-PP phosphatase [Edwardsiella anguillarum]
MRLAAFDMDGTLLMPDHCIGAETLDTLQRLAQQRVVLTFATGRHFLEVSRMTRRLGLRGHLITGNGTRVHDHDGQLLFSQDLAPEVAYELMHADWSDTASLHLFRDDGWLTASDCPELLAPHRADGFAYRLTDLRRLPAYGVSKVCFIDRHERLLSLQQRLRAHFGRAVDLCFSGHDSLEVIPPGSNKGSALAALCERLNIGLDECMAFGDAMNDREMLGMVGQGFIMGNALTQLRQALPHLRVIGDCRQQAVAQQLSLWLTQSHLTIPPNH